MSNAGATILGVFLAISLFVNGFGFISYTDIQQENEQLQKNYSSLNQSYNFLNQQYSTLQDKYNALDSKYHSLQNKYNTLQLNYTSLDLQYKNLQSDYDLMKNQYDSVIENINKRHGLPKYAQKFITPTDSKVKSKVKEILGSSYNGKLTWDDMNKIYNWVHNNIKYNSDTDDSASKGNAWGECWLYPSETLNKKKGDCEDQTLLFVSLCLAEENAGWIFCAELDVDGNGHMVAFINAEGDKMNIYDPTNGYKSPYSMSESNAISAYKSAAGYSSVRVKVVINQGYYKTFSSNQEFYDWF